MRRTLPTFATILFLLGGAVAVSSCQQQESAPTASQKKGPPVPRPEGLASGRALSLRVLQKNLQDCVPKGTCLEEVLHMVGIKKVLGYVIDSSNKDIIVFGSLDAALPPLYLEDFVLALRNTWLKYAELRGSTYYYSPPGCSIDPDPNILRRLEQVADWIHKEPSPEKVKKRLEQWHSECRRPQQVRVLGIPFDTRFAKVMVDADYYMKRLVDGSVTLDIPGFISLTDMALTMARQGMETGKKVSIPASSLDRFWFYPGENTFLEDTGVAYIKKSEVTLLSEEEFLSATGKVEGTGRPSPLAKRFAESFTEQYSAIAKARPIYAELEGLFRFVALARIMKRKNALSESGLKLDYLFDQYPIPNTAVSRSLLGVSSAKEFRHRTEMPGGYRELYLWLPSCGGVGIDIQIKDKDISRDNTGGLRQQRAAALKARPNTGSLSWEFSGG